MKDGRLPFAVTLFVLLFCLAAPGRAEIVYLDANFDGETVDAIVGMRGPAFGEPLYIDPTAGGYVRSGPMATPSLEFVDGSDTYLCTAWFILVNQTRMATGRAVITADLWVDEVGGTAVPLRVDIRQTNPSVFTFVTAEFRSDGVVRLYDADGPVGNVGTFATGVTQSLRIVINLDTHTYDFQLDGSYLVADEPFTGGDVGVSQILFGTGADSDLIGRFYLDNLRVADPDHVAVQPITWGRLLRMFAP
jgi:hypothetical protein